MAEKSTGKVNRRRCGTYYEDLAARYLIRKGYEILERNYHAGRLGEIDLIAYEKQIGTLVFAEVKYRSSDTYGHPAEAVDHRKQATIRKCAACYLAQRPVEIPIRQVRFDVLALYGADLITHYRNAF